MAEIVLIVHRILKRVRPDKSDEFGTCDETILRNIMKQYRMFIRKEEEEEKSNLSLEEQ